MEFRRGSATAFAKSAPNGHSFNERSIYDGVFGGQRNANRSAIEDYGEIFGGSGASIPVLEVPELNESKMTVDVRSSKLDYTKIFGGFADFEFAASHEELFLAKPKMENESPAKAPALSESTIPSSFPVANEVSSHEVFHESFDGKKEVKVLYNRSSPGSENGTNGTMHVAQLHEVPGYSSLIDEVTQEDKPDPSALHGKCSTSDGKMGVRHYRRTMSELPPGGVYNQNSEGGREVQNKSQGDGTHRNGVVSEEHEVDDVGKHPSKVRRASSLPKSAGNSKCGSSKWASMSHFSGDVSGLSSPPDLDEEVDANSVAATSAAAVTKAIEEAQASIKIALELMERKKEGNMKPSFDGLKVKEKTSSKRKKNASKSAQVVPDLGHIETLELFETSHIKGEPEKRESAKQGEMLDNVMRSINECEPEEKRPDEDRKEDGKKVDTMKESDLQESENGLKSSGEVLDQKGDGNKLIFARIWDKIEEMLGVSTDQEAFGGELNKLEDDAHQCMVDNDEKQSEAPQDESCPGANDLFRTAESQPVLQDITTQEKCLNGFEDASEVIKPEEEKEEFCGLEENYEKHDVCVEDHAEKPLDEIGKMETDEEGLNGFQYEEENENKLEEEEKAGGNVDESGNVTEEAFKIKDSEDIHEGTSEGGNTDRIADEVDQSVEGTITGATEEGQRGASEGVNSHMEQEEIDQNVEGEKTGENEEREGVGTHLLQEETDQSVESKKIGDNEERQRGTLEWADTHVILEETDEKLEGGKTGENEEKQNRTSECVNTHVVQEETDQSVEDEKTGDTEQVLKCEMDVSETVEDASEQVELQIPMENQEPCRDECFEGVEIDPEQLACDENVAIEEPTEACCGFKETRREHEAVEVDNNMEYAGVFDTSGLAESISELDEIKRQTENDGESLDFGKNRMNVGLVDMTFEQLQHDQQAKDSDVFCKIETNLKELESELEEGNPDSEVDGVAEQQENKDIMESRDGVRCVDDGECIGAEQPPCIFEEKEETVGVAHEDLANQSTEKDERKHCETLMEMERESKATSSKEMDVKKEERRKRDEAKERKRERELERKAVERAVREARERAFAEAREKAERAAAERVNAEARRRTMSEARGKLEKPSAEANDKITMESKIKAERAAVERATAEARQRALEKAISEKASFNARNQADKFSSERSFGSSRDNGTKHNIPPYDSHSNVSDHSASSRHTSSSNNGVAHSFERYDGGNGEPAQRCKARLERHQRTAERAAKALAEKNMRDLLAQKEQTERNRLAETLDSEVKRWAKGKEGNLRALLSTLQYILGPESGWQPISLTDLIATAAVKKAYKKSTLYVHPDKLQQRGASIQQKYTCEKVFDLLKAAWNKFNADER